MNISGRAAAALLAALASATVGLVAPVSESRRPGDRKCRAPQPRPNVVLILTDDMRADELRYMPKTRRLLVGRASSSPTPSRRTRCAARRAPSCSPGSTVRTTASATTPDPGAAPGADATRREHRPVAAAAGYRTSFHGKFLNGYERQPAASRPAGRSGTPRCGGIYTYRRARFFNGDRVHRGTSPDHDRARRTRRSGDFADGRRRSSP